MIIELLFSFRLSSEIRMAEMSSMGIGSKPCLDIRPSSDQINDRSISFSQLGKGKRFVAKEFEDLSNRKKLYIHSAKIPQLIRRHAANEVITPSQFHHFFELIGVVGRLFSVFGV